VTYSSGVNKDAKQQFNNSAGGNQLIKEPGSARRLRLTQTNSINYSTQHNINWHSAATLSIVIELKFFINNI